ncbi:MAG TPA: hypothetical protein IAA79_05260 [Candidatus Avirikenella pullistercoris]|nr:hypothetical protein [Candidatus Avirikenella pullistercoris]
MEKIIQNKESVVPASEADIVSAELQPRWKTRYLKRYPDASVVDDTELENLFYEDYDTAMEQLKNLVEDNRALYKLIVENPETGILLKELISGTPLRVALIRANLIPEEPSAEDEDYQAYIDAVNERKVQMRRAEEQKKIREKNRKKSESEVADFFASKEMDEEEAERFIDFVDNVLLGNITNDIYDKQLLEKLWHAFKYEEEIRNAREAGVIEGRNAQIETRRLKAAGSSDGLPGSGNAVVADIPRKKGYIERLMSDDAYSY